MNKEQAITVFRRLSSMGVSSAVHVHVDPFRDATRCYVTFDDSVGLEILKTIAEETGIKLTVSSARLG